MERRNQMYEGKAKILYETDDPALAIQLFKDDASAFNAKKLGNIVDKGVFNNSISSKLFEEVEANGVPTHFVKKISDREMLVKKLDMLKVEVVVRNIVAGSLARRLGIDEGKHLPHPIIDLHNKDDSLSHENQKPAALLPSPPLSKTLTSSSGSTDDSHASASWTATTCFSGSSKRCDKIT